MLLYFYICTRDISNILIKIIFNLVSIDHVKEIHSYKTSLYIFIVIQLLFLSKWDFFSFFNNYGKHNYINARVKLRNISID